MSLSDPRTASSPGPLPTARRLNERRPSIRFLGGVGTVTGSRFLLSTSKSTVLIDCGLYQGHKELRLRNRADMRFNEATLDAVVITHAHVDHIGFVPALVRRGFCGTVHMTEGSKALAEVVLPDAGRLQEEDASHANAVGSSRHRPAEPLFTEEDARQALELISAHPFESPVRVSDDVTVTFNRSGHILGSAWLRIEVDGFGSVAVSGDLGRPQHPLLLPATPLSAVDTILVESTYGDRLHESVDVEQRLAELITTTAKRGGTVVIPSFAVDRTEVLLMCLRRLSKSGAIPDLPVFVDSPMALEALRAYRQAISERWPEIRPEAFDESDPFDTGRLHESRTVEDSKAIGRIRYPSIIISASGMATGGRVLHHLVDHLPNSRDTIVLPGFQVAGTRGAQLAAGARQVKIFGEYIDVRSEVVALDGFSVHADRAEILGWLGTAPEPPDTCFVVHGEAEASHALAESIHDTLGWRAVVPTYDELVLVGSRHRPQPPTEPIPG